MSQPNISCTVCHGNEFSLEAGFYFCVECNTQSQDVREVVFDDFFGNQKATTRALKGVQKKNSKQSNSGSNERLTSWEVFNYILKGITDELIDLGAKQELKIVTLQLWASYLRKLDVAFTSVEIERKPKLGYAFKRSDAEIIYGVTDKQLKEKSWNSRSRSISGSSLHSNESKNTSVSGGESRRSIMRNLSIRKKALASAEYSQMSQNTSMSYSQTLEDLNISSDGAETPQRLKITRHAKELLSSSCASSTEDDLSERRKVLRKEKESVRHVTLAKIAALSSLALALTNQDIQVSDYIRWIDEGHISFRSWHKFLPEGIKLEPQIQRMLDLGHVSYTSCHSLMAQLSRELGITAIPLPNLNRLAERYCLELQLPGDLAGVIKRILCLVSDSHNQHTSKEICFEVQAMAAIIVCLKLLFSLDDCTEYNLSHTATQLNRVLGNQSFVYTDWVKFIECRKAVVAAYHLPTRSAVYGDTMGRDSELFVQHYSQFMDQQQNSRGISKRYVLNKTWVEAMVRCLRKLADHQPKSELSNPIHFPASLTPLHTCCQFLLEHHADQVHTAWHILSQDFTTHSLEYIFTPERTLAVSLANNLIIHQRPEGAAAVFKVEDIVPKDKSDVVVPRFKINQAKMTIRIVQSISTSQENSHEPEINSEEYESKLEISNDNKSSLYTKAKEIISDDSDEEDNNEDEDMIKNIEISNCETVLQLFDTASQYWCIHTKLDKNNMNNDEFDVFAMETFPSSFLWLLKECSRMISVPMKELYSDVIFIEKKINSILMSVNKNKKAKRKR